MLLKKRKNGKDAVSLLVSCNNFHTTFTLIFVNHGRDNFDDILHRQKFDYFDFEKCAEAEEQILLKLESMGYKPYCDDPRVRKFYKRLPKEVMLEHYKKTAGAVMF